MLANVLTKCPKCGSTTVLQSSIGWCFSCGSILILGDSPITEKVEIAGKFKWRVVNRDYLEFVR